LAEPRITERDTAAETTAALGRHFGTLTLFDLVRVAADELAAGIAEFTVITFANGRRGRGLALNPANAHAASVRLYPDETLEYVGSVDIPEHRPCFRSRAPAARRHFFDATPLVSDSVAPTP
jgi:hypothetical protein